MCQIDRQNDKPSCGFEDLLSFNNNDGYETTTQSDFGRASRVRKQQIDVSKQDGLYIRSIVIVMAFFDHLDFVHQLPLPFFIRMGSFAVALTLFLNR